MNRRGFRAAQLERIANRLIIDRAIRAFFEPAPDWQRYWRIIPGRHVSRC